MGIRRRDRDVCRRLLVEPQRDNPSVEPDPVPRPRKESLMARQMLQDGPYLDPPIAAPLSADTGTGAVLMWNPLQYTKFYGDEARAGRVYCVRAGGILPTKRTGALTISPGL